MFVKGGIRVESLKEVMIIQNHAVQTLDESSVVFVRKSKNEFTPVPVKLGKSDDLWTEVIKGLNIGDEYVSYGALELKAEIVTDSLGSHAGHGH